MFRGGDAGIMALTLLLPEKTGLPRLLEALEGNEWAATETADDDIDFEGSSAGSDLLFGAELDSNEDELSAALLDEPRQKGEEERKMDGGEAGSDRQVLELERMMSRMQAVKGKSNIPFASSVQGESLNEACLLSYGSRYATSSKKKVRCQGSERYLGIS